MPELATDERFDTFEHRRIHRAELVTAIEDRLRQADTVTWVDRLTTEGVPCSAINDVAEAFAEPQAVSRGVVGEARHPTLGTVRHVASPMRFAAQPPSAPKLAPRRAEHQQEVLGELCGYAKARISQLRDAGAFGNIPQAS